MNKTRIEWCDYSWNAVTGCPTPHCWYCYAKKMYRRFPALGNPDFLPKFFSERLDELGKLKKPAKIFVCSVADLFAAETKEEWRQAIFDEMEKYPQHIYILLTKRPHLIKPGLNLGSNVWVGATINNEAELDKAEHLKVNYHGHKFISFEPLLGRIPAQKSLSALEGIEWVIIGRITGVKKVFIPKEFIQEILDVTKELDISTFVKNNVDWPWSIQNWPTWM